jgi:hypothetical protein
MAARDSDLSADYLRPEKSDKIGEIDPLALRGPLQAAAPGAYAEAARGGFRPFAATAANGEIAPIADLPALTLEREGSTP